MGQEALTKPRTKAGVRCVKVTEVRASGDGGGSCCCRRIQPHQGPAPVQDYISPGESSRVALRASVRVVGFTHRTQCVASTRLALVCVLAAPGAFTRENRALIHRADNHVNMAINDE